jgi:L-rhamnose isomerase / sugar isomerase
VALHIPWDRVDDYARLAKHAADAGLRIGAINPNVRVAVGERRGPM